MATQRLVQAQGPAQGQAQGQAQGPAQGPAQAQAPGLHPAILRFNFSEDIMSRITYFAKLHQFEDRHTYKTNWNHWWEENQHSLEAEIRRLETSGYEGDAKDKMYKAGRYYFRKKTGDQAPPGEVKKRSNKYITINKTILEEMDKHIITSMQNDRAYTPALGYTAFCNRCAALLLVETERLKLTARLDEAKINNKLKKTYKNRYFIVTR